MGDEYAAFEAEFEDYDDEMQELLAHEHETDQPKPVIPRLGTAPKKLNFDDVSSSQPDADPDTSSAEKSTTKKNDKNGEMDLSPQDIDSTLNSTLGVDPNIIHGDNEMKLEEPPKERTSRFTEFDDMFSQRSRNEEIDFAQPRKKRRIDPSLQCVFDRAPVGEGSISITADNGDRCYLKMQSVRSFQREMSEYSKTRKKRSGSLLRTPVRDLLEDIEKETFKREERERKEAFEAVKEKSVKSDGPKKVQKALWVDKYAPKKFTDLLSNERVNREVLGWLKTWDEVVFGAKKNVEKRKKHKKSSVPSIFRTSIPRATRRSPNKRGGAIQSAFASNKEDKRPDHKLVLLCGPPGTGKTTLGHVLANHSGYNVIEINASDNRTAKHLSHRIRAAVENQSVIGGDKRPNLVILDEIDGVDGGQRGSRSAMTELLKIAGIIKTESKKKKETKLSRPIICICNDPYSPALRALREAALVFTFDPPKKNTLCQRLQHICRKEKIQADLRTLGTLAESAENDVRSCLNTLQFLKNRASPEGPQTYTKLTGKMVSSVSFGRKDITKGLFQAWSAVFCKPKQSSKYGERSNKAARDAVQMMYGAEAAKQSTKQIQWTYLHSIVSSQDGDKIIQGMHENFLDVGYSDPTFHKTAEVAEWMCYGDVLSSYIRRSQNFSIMPYIPYAAVAIHEEISTDRSFRAKYPRRAWELMQGIQKNESIMESFLVGSDDRSSRGGSGAGLKKFIPKSMAVLELLPYLVNIICPNLKSVPIHQMEGGQKKLLEHLVDTMISYNLDYKAYTSYTFNGRKLYPNIDEIVDFQKEAVDKHVKGQYSNFKSYIDETKNAIEYKGTDNSLQNLRRGLSGQTKDILSHQIELEKMRRLERPNLGASSSQLTSSQVPLTPQKRPMGGLGGGGVNAKSRIGGGMMMPPANKTPRGTSKPQIPHRTPKGTGQFGEKARSTNPEPSPARGVTFMSKSSKTIDRVFYPIHFQFVEGYTCAVRRKVFVGEFV